MQASIGLRHYHETDVLQRCCEELAICRLWQLQVLCTLSLSKLHRVTLSPLQIVICCLMPMQCCCNIAYARVSCMHTSILLRAYDGT